MVHTFFLCIPVEPLPCSRPGKVMTGMVAHTLVNNHNRMVVNIFVLLRDLAALGNSSENLEQFKATFVSISNCHYGFE